jgi:hypothetical protein
MLEDHTAPPSLASKTSRAVNSSAIAPAIKAHPASACTRWSETPAPSPTAPGVSAALPGSDPASAKQRSLATSRAFFPKLGVNHRAHPVAIGLKPGIVELNSPKSRSIASHDIDSAKFFHLGLWLKHVPSKITAFSGNA